MKFSEQHFYYQKMFIYLFFFKWQIFVNHDKSVVIVIFLIATTIFNEFNEIIFQKMFRILPQLNKNI